MYPGYLYVRDLASYRDGMTSLHRRVRGRYRFSFGAHIEMSRSGQLYPPVCKYQPDEAAPAQLPDVLDALVATLQQPHAPMGVNWAITPKSKM